MRLLVKLGPGEMELKYQRSTFNITIKITTYSHPYQLYLEVLLDSVHTHKIKTALTFR